MYKVAAMVIIRPATSTVQAAFLVILYEPPVLALTGTSDVSDLSFFLAVIGYSVETVETVETVKDVESWDITGAPASFF
jgi:hypothetical protein